MSIGWGIIGIGRHSDLKVVPAMKSAAETKLIAAFSRDRGEQKPLPKSTASRRPMITT